MVAVGLMGFTVVSVSAVWQEVPENEDSQRRYLLDTQSVMNHAMHPRRTVRHDEHLTSREGG